MQCAPLLASGRTAPSFHTSCSTSAFRRQAFTAQRPRRSIALYHKQKSQLVRSLVATGGSDSEDDEPTPEPSTSSFSASQSSVDFGFGLNPDLEQPVPTEQRPVNELAALRETWLYSWVCKGFTPHFQLDSSPVHDSKS